MHAKLHCVYHETKTIQSAVSSIVVVSALFHSVNDL